MNLKISPTYLDYMALLLQGRYLKKFGGDLTGDILAQHVFFRYESLLKSRNNITAENTRKSLNKIILSNFRAIEQC